MRYAEIIKEVTSSTPWNWVHQGDEKAVAKFKVGNVDYVFEATNTQHDHQDSEYDSTDDGDTDEGTDYSGYWVVEFRAVAIDSKPVPQGQDVSMLGTGNAAQVISVVTKILESFIDTYGFGIDVIEYDTQGDASRAGVYSRMFKRLLPNWRQVPGELHDVEVHRL